MAEPCTENFPVFELRCKCEICRLEVPNECSTEALTALQRVREEFGKPITLTSAYRCENHPKEARKTKPGRHNEGIAFDILVPWGSDRMTLLMLAAKHGFSGFGFANSFLHIDYRDTPYASWGYSK